MRILWTLESNTKSMRGAFVLYTQVRRQLEGGLSLPCIEGDRYSGHRISFMQTLTGMERPEALYRLLAGASRLGNSWTLERIEPRFAAFSLRSRVAGLQRLTVTEEEHAP